MKKFITAIALLAAVCACSKKELNVEENTPSTGKQIITATVNVSTKVTYSENTPGGGGGISSVWAAGDKFYAIQDGTTVKYNMYSGIFQNCLTLDDLFH